MSGFFAELQRRKVYRVAVAYIIAGGFIIQIASAIFPAWELPNWSQRLLIVLILAGFPIALIFAWVFDVTPAGIERTSKVESERPAVSSHRRRNLILLAAAGLVISFAAGFFVLPRAAARKIDKSIAVLPFESLSGDKENAYFADGIQDDILTNLSKIRDLKVISRTSVMSYRGNTRNVRDIGKALGVSSILEGSVRRSGNKVRVNVQLIDTATDQHIWAEDYDGDLSDVFKIQTDLARQIASALEAKLSPAEKEHIERKPTENGEAYLAFVRAHELQGSAYEDSEKLKLGEQMYQVAIDKDPTFALAYARYSQLESWLVHSFGRTPERRDKARTLAQRALELQPQLPEAHLALGFVHYYIDNDFEAAAKEFEIAQRGLPNDAEGYLALGAIQRRQGKWAQSNASLEKAVSLNPKSVWALQNLAINYEMQRDFAAANRNIDRALAIDPKGLGPLGLKAQFAIEEKGDFSVGEKILAELKPDTFPPEIRAQLLGNRISFLVLQRKFDEARADAEKIPDPLIAAFPGALCGKYKGIGTVKKATGDEAGARELFLRAKSFAENDLKQNPDDATVHARLAEVLGWLGEKQNAIAEIKRAQEILPESKDAFGGAEITSIAAEIYANLGDVETAVAILDGMLQRPGPITVSLLKLNPIWDPIRQDPRFQALIDKYGAKS